MAHGIRLVGVRQNNLKNLSLEIPLERFVCITGPSGSGKSSLAFDTLYAEGYRRYVESLSTYARQFFERVPKPDIETVENIPPAIALQQKNSVRNSRSTVGTSTEVYDYLRLLFSKLGNTYCPQCGKLIRAFTPQSAAAAVLASLNDENDRGYVGFFLKEDTPASQLIERGFLRRLSSIKSPESIELETEKQVVLKKKSLIIYDRLVVSEKERHRLVESLEASFREGTGEAFVYLVRGEFRRFSSDFGCSDCEMTLAKPTPLLFSFNSPLGACAHCKGFGNTLEYDEKLLVPNPRLSLNKGAVAPFTKTIMKRAQKKLFEFAEKNNIPLHESWSDLSEEHVKQLLYGQGSFKGIVGLFKKAERKKYKLHVRVFLRRYQSAFVCTVCRGSRLRSEALNVKVKGKTIFDLVEMPLGLAQEWFDSISWSETERTIAKEVLRQISSRLRFLNQMGLSYLTLSRLSKTLSGGESQRINLANQLGAELAGTLYVLDEPSIGLHPSDRDRLLAALHDLIQLGNSIVVVEHDLDTILHAEHIIELGPESGRGGGAIVFQGDKEQFLKSPTLTARYARGESRVALPKTIRLDASRWLTIQGASENNLKNITFKLPLHRFVGIAGISGSGKSSLIHQTLYNALARIFYQSTDPIGRFKKVFGAERLSGISLLDQSVIGRSSRSIPLTIINGYDEVRALFGGTAQAKQLGVGPRHFSFNISGGRCETCLGEGVVKTEMYFLEDLYLPCEICGGKRFKREILEIKYKGKSIHDVLNFSVHEARLFFSATRSLHQRLLLLEKVGLGYLQLGQSSHTLSGGESQRLKIASEFLNSRKSNILYILDEPTTGLHASEVGLLIQLLQELVDAGNTVVVVEHNIDVLKTCDWLIELGPGAGEEGGRIVAEGIPQDVAQSKTRTAPFLKKAFQV